MTTLALMTAAEYEAWREESIPNYARDKVVAGQWREAESLENSHAEVDQLLPQGLATPGHHLWAVRDDAHVDSVGAMWVAEQQHGARRIAYVFDFLVKPQHRRQGHARRAFLALEHKVDELNLEGISLHVFGHNDAARALYESLGYAPTNITMFKRVDTSR
jgi:ribosomal protein S18 acetylase RimI-like enzyme